MHRSPAVGPRGDLRDGRPGGDPRRRPLERERQQPRPLLRPYVESGEVSLICESTPEEFAAAHGGSRASSTRSTASTCPSRARTTRARSLIAAGRGSRPSQGVEIDREAIAAALELTRRFEPYRALPGKAVRPARGSRAADRHARTASRASAARSVTATFAARTGLPLLLLSDEVSLRAARCARSSRSACSARPTRSTRWST